MLPERERKFLDLIYEKYAGSLFACSLSLLRSLPDASSIAEECVQETFETAMRKMKILEQHPAPEAWLNAVCNFNEGYEKCDFHKKTNWGQWLSTNEQFLNTNPQKGGGGPLQE